MVFCLPPSEARTTNFFLPYPGSPLRILRGELTLLGLPFATTFAVFNCLSHFLGCLLCGHYSFCCIWMVHFSYSWHNFILSKLRQILEHFLGPSPSFRSVHFVVGLSEIEVASDMSRGGHGSLRPLVTVVEHLGRGWILFL